MFRKQTINFKIRRLKKEVPCLLKNIFFDFSLSFFFKYHHVNFQRTFLFISFFLEKQKKFDFVIEVRFNKPTKKSTLF
jgi:hypothetical protein